MAWVVIWGMTAIRSISNVNVIFSLLLPSLLLSFIAPSNKRVYDWIQRNSLHLTSLCFPSLFSQTYVPHSDRTLTHTPHLSSSPTLHVYCFRRCCSSHLTFKERRVHPYQFAIIAFLDLTVSFSRSTTRLDPVGRN